MAKHRPEWTSQTFKVLSWLTDTAVVPSAVSATQITLSLCPFHVATDEAWSSIFQTARIEEGMGMDKDEGLVVGGWVVEP